MLASILGRVVPLPRATLLLLLDLEELLLEIPLCISILHQLLNHCCFTLSPRRTRVELGRAMLDCANLNHESS